MGNIVLSSFVAGVIGTGIGGVLGVVIGITKKNVIDCVLAVAGGIMLAIVFFDLVPESFLICEDSMVVLIGLIWGVLVMYILNWVVKRTSKSIIVNVCCIIECGKSLSRDQKYQMKKSGMFLCFAIALHNMPEGLAVGASSVVDVEMGLVMAVIICLHNIPEGLAMSLPLSIGGLKKWKSILLSMVAGGVTVIGGLIGFFVGHVNPLWTAFALAFAVGAMLQVSLNEMIFVDNCDKSKDKIVACLIVGIVLGYLFILFV